jgi:hypothetical protein
MNRYVYGRAWNYKTLVMGGQITVDEARRRYESGGDDDWFGVAAYAEGVPDGGVPEFSLEIRPRGEFIRVTFFDRECRIAVKYAFTEEDGRLFLREITKWTYPDDGQYYRRDGSLVMENNRYEPDGTLHWTRTDSVADVTERARYQDVDLSRHWEPIPPFGEWEQVARFDRWE